MGPGVVKLTFNRVGGGALPSAVRVKKTGQEAFNVGLQGDGAVGIPVDRLNETITLSSPGFSLDPSQISVQFSGTRLNEEERFDITLTPVWASSINLVASASDIEAGGAGFPEKRPQETVELTTEVKNIAGQPMEGVSVRFEVAEKTGNASVKFSQEGLRSNHLIRFYPMHSIKKP